MAMTKKERAEWQAAIDKAALLAALRWTTAIARDVPAPALAYSEGWDFNAYSKEVWLGWSGPVSHGTGPAPKPGERHQSGSQNPRAMFSTRGLALKALRHEVERASAQDLMRIDRLIAGAEAEGQA